MIYPTNVSYADALDAIRKLREAGYHADILVNGIWTDCPRSEAQSITGLPLVEKPPSFSSYIAPHEPTEFVNAEIQQRYPHVRAVRTGYYWALWQGGECLTKGIDSCRLETLQQCLDWLALNEAQRRHGEEP